MKFMLQFQSEMVLPPTRRWRGFKPRQRWGCVSPIEMSRWAWNAFELRRFIRNVPYPTPHELVVQLFSVEFFVVLPLEIMTAVRLVDVFKCNETTVLLIFVIFVIPDKTNLGECTVSGFHDKHSALQRKNLV